MTLIGFEHFPGHRISVILNAIFQNVPCQQQQQADRYTIFQIFETSLKLFKQGMSVLLKYTYISDLIIFLLDVLNMKLDFVYGVLQAIQGERNPINLLFLFKWLKEFLMDIPLHHLTEDMFDVLACYFPVDFRAPSNENVIFYYLLIVLSCCNICFSEYNKRRFGRCFVSMFVCQSRFWGILHFFGSGKIGFFFRNCQTG